MAIVKHVVEFLGGKIVLKSELNKGTSIEVNLPKPTPSAENEA